jgi:spectinomycin phosphotransferase/16S rRNA (guanine(1405)-N(7))-methyltransferase
VLHPPEDLDEAALGATLTREWGVAVASMDYQPLGFGSHHWSVVDGAGTSWFATVDDLQRKRRSERDTHDAAYRRLRSALDTARGLRETGAEFVLAPLITAGDEPVARIRDRYAVALYPLVRGDSFGFNQYDGDAHRHAVLDMVVAVHAAPPQVRARAAADDQVVPHRDALEAAMAGGPAPDCGPYAGRVAELFTGHAAAIRTLLARYDELACRVDPSRAVLTHGETHPGNTMRTPDGWRLIDWDTALIAQPERDLWMLGDDMPKAYAERTGVTPLPELLEVYRLRWDIADLAVEADRFRQPHTGTPDDVESFAILQRVIATLPQ